VDDRWQSNPQLDLVSDSPGEDVTPERWQQIKSLFGAALERSPEGRAAFLQEACGSDESLRAEVESLLAEQQPVTTSPASSAPSTSQSAPQVEAEDAMVGRSLGAYEIVRRIATGGMATVYLAARSDAQYRKLVAIKLLTSGFDSPEIMRRFRNERQTLAALDHPNIVKLLDGGTTPEGVPYLVMDYVEGVAIDEYCDGHKLCISERLRLFRTVCAAVEYAHQKGAIHRDLKPSNILVTVDGVCKLLDFGIAKVLNPELSAGTLQLTQSGDRQLTPAYASPEQVRGEPVTCASDVYSLGVVLYELLTGHRPYKLKRHTPMELERVICDTDPERPSTAVSQVETETAPDGSASSVITPESVSQTREGEPQKLRRRLRGDLDNILLMALQKKPQRRYASVEEFSADIVRHLEHRPVKARPNTLQYRTRKLIRRRKTEVVALVLLLVLAGGWAHNLWRQGWWRVPFIPQVRAKTGVPAIHSLAVLPLRNLSGDPNQEYLADGMTEGLITELSGISALKVISRTSVMPYKKSEKSLPEIARELRVDGIVEGSVMRSGDQVRVMAQLIYAPEDKNVWARSFERQFQDSLTLQSEVASAIAAAVRTQIEPDEKTRLQTARSVNPKALEAYLQGTYHLSKYGRGSGDDEVRTAISFFQQAIAEDPTFAQAYVKMGDAYDGLMLPASERIPLERTAAQKALALDPNLAEAHMSLGDVNFKYDWDWQAAQREFKRAIDLSPSNADAHKWFSTYLYSQGRWNESKAEAELAQRLDPALLFVYCLRGEEDRFIALERNYLEFNPDDGFIHLDLAELYARKGMQKEHIAELQRTAALFGFSKVSDNIAATYAASGYRAALRYWALALDRNGINRPEMVAQAYVRAGDKDLAFKWLERAFRERSNYMVFLNVEPVYDPLRSDPRFKDLLRRVGLPETTSPQPSQPANPKAREDLLKGIYHSSQAYELLIRKSGGQQKSDEEFAKGISYLERAIQDDPNYAPAYLALARAIIQELPQPKLASKGMEALHEALALDENNAEIHLLMARSMGISWSSWGDPQDEYKRAIQLKPDWAEAHDAYAAWLDNVGRFDDGMNEHQKAQTLDPKTDYLSSSPLIPLAERLERTRKFMSINTPVPVDYWYRGELEYELGQYAEALKDWVGPAREFGWNQEADAWERAYATGGPQALIQEMTKTLDGIAKHRWWPRDVLIDVHRYAGDRRGALTWLETAAKECGSTFQQVCDHPVLETLRSDRRWDPYRSDPRFQTIARSLDLAP
jgi:serine/threonine protein kinase/Tfp pilus assembly protein PilF